MAADKGDPKTRVPKRLRSLGEICGRRRLKRLTGDLRMATNSWTLQAWCGAGGRATADEAGRVTGDGTYAGVGIAIQSPPREIRK